MRGPGVAVSGDLEDDPGHQRAQASHGLEQVGQRLVGRRAVERADEEDPQRVRGPGPGGEGRHVHRGRDDHRLAGERAAERGGDVLGRAHHPVGASRGGGEDEALVGVADVGPHPHLAVDRAGVVREHEGAVADRPRGEVGEHGHRRVGVDDGHPLVADEPAQGAHPPQPERRVEDAGGRVQVADLDGGVPRLRGFGGGGRRGRHHDRPQAVALVERLGELLDVLLHATHVGPEVGRHEQHRVAGAEAAHGPVTAA